MPAFLDKWIQQKDHYKQTNKNIHEAITAATPAVMETLCFLWKKSSYLVLNAAFGVQDCCEKGMVTDTNVTWEKANSLHDNLKQKDDEGNKGQEFNGKGWFENFRKRFGLKMSR